MAVNFHISKDGNLVTIRHLKNSFDLAGTETDKFVHIPRYQEDFNTTTYHLTASNPSGSNIKIVGEDGRVIINSIAFTSLKTGASNANIGATASATVSTLNGTNFFGAGSIDDDISSNTSSHTNNNSTIQSNLTKITSLENAVKTASGDRGVYITNAKDETSSKVKLTSTTAKLQAGGKTGIEADESSPGTLTFTVAAGASGSEVETTAYTIEGTTAGRTTHTFVGDTALFKANASSGGGRISLHEATANGTNALTLAAPASLTASTLLTFPDGAGSNGQVLSTNGSGTLSWVDNTGVTAIHAGASDILRLQSSQIGVSTNLTSTIGADRLVFYDHSDGKLAALELGTNLAISGTTLNATDTDTNTNIANTDLTLDAARTLNLSGNDLDIQSGGSSRLLFDVSANQGTGEWLFGSRARFTQPVEFAASGGTTQSQIRFREPPLGGTSSVILKGPSTNLTSDLTFVLPDADGSAGQFITTDGSGNLSFASASGGGGGPILLGQYGGRFQWSSADEGERVALNTFYGFSYFSHSTELSQVAMNTYSASQTVDSTTTTVDNKKLGLISFPVLTTDKKVKCCYSFFLQSHNTGSTWGMSLWSGTLDTSGNLDSERTVTLRAETADITATTNSNTRLYHGEFTTTSNINGGRIIPMIENRTGNWSGTVYAYGVFQLYYVD